MNLSGSLGNNVIAGNNSLFEVEKILLEGGYKNILLITGKESFKSCKAQSFFERIKKNLTIVSFSGKTLQVSFINDKYNNLVKNGIYDLIIGIGGGSILDAAKIFSIMLSNEYHSAEELIESGGGANKIDLVLIPTTAGPGSEATSFAVIYNEHSKYSILSDPLNVKHIILDPRLLINVPPDLLLVTLLDAFSQAIESMWSINSNSESMKYAKAALQILADKKLLSGDPEDLHSLLLASHFAGKAINISRTTAAHAFSYPLTAHFSIPHGLAVSFFLIEFIKFNSLVNDASVNDVRGVQYVHDRINDILDILGFESIEIFKTELRNLINNVGFEFELGEMVSNEEFYDLVFDGINLERLQNNPRKVTQADAKLIIDNVYSFLKKPV